MVGEIQLHFVGPAQCEKGTSYYYGVLVSTKMYNIMNVPSTDQL